MQPMMETWLLFGGFVATLPIRMPIVFWLKQQAVKILFPPLFSAPM